MPLRTATILNKPVSPKAPIHFGWWANTHKEINMGAINLLQSSPWQQYLETHFKRLSYIDDLQDVFERGPKHFINIEDKENKWLFGISEAYPTWKNVNSRFKNTLRNKLNKKWQNNSQPMPIPKEANVITSILNAYDNTIAFLQSPSQAKSLPKHQLDEQLGRLMHYIGDLYMPLHTSRYFDWNAFEEQGLHEFIERDLLSYQNYRHISQQAYQQQNQIAQLSPENLKTFLTQETRRSHLKIFKIVAAHRNIKKRLPLNTSSNDIEKALKQELTPLISQQIIRAQIGLSAILQLIRSEGLKPIPKALT